MLTNHCIYDCRYCINRASSDTPRARFTPEEVVWLTLEFYRRNYIEGLFLSSGIIQSPDYTMEQLVRVAQLLREVHEYHGYIHLKSVPGASADLLAQAGKYADRLSTNIELPTDADLAKLAPEKKPVEIQSAMSQIRDGVEASKEERSADQRAPQFAPAGQSTQMIVGATPSTDATILATAAQLYRRQRLRRVYYSAYSPIPRSDDRLPAQSPPLIREHRLYQADWLVRFYGFSSGELTTSAEPNLDLSIDPKLAWALRHREFFPIDINKASRSALHRVPGLGFRNVQRIVTSRRFRAIRVSDLKRLGVSLKKVRPFVLWADHNPDAALIDRQDLCNRVAPINQQLELFQTKIAAGTGEL